MTAVDDIGIYLKRAASSLNKSNFYFKKKDIKFVAYAKDAKQTLEKALNLIKAMT